MSAGFKCWERATARPDMGEGERLAYIRGYCDGWRSMPVNRAELRLLAPDEYLTGHRRGERDKAKAARV